MSLNVALLDADVSNVTYILVSSPLPTAIEALRRAIYEKNGDGALADSLLTSVTVGAVSYMYIFRISQNVELDDLDLSQVNVVESSSFTPHDLVFPAFPAACMRSIVTNFLNAVRISIIDSVAEKPCVLGRLKTGFLISYATPSNEWSSAWVVPRPHSFCHLQVHLAQSRLIVHPLLVPTTFVPLSPTLPAGTPITLLPFGTSAYYLTSYHGPTSALSRQFQDAFVGLGVHSWNRESYIIAWIAVENKQGEDKGVTIIYPASLCVQSTSSTHPPLSHIPTLPATLQSSPDPAGSPTPAMSFLSLSGPASATAFRTLTNSKSRDVAQIAKEVGGYVDAVAKEREKERQRIKREREGATSRTASQSFISQPEQPAFQPQPLPPPLLQHNVTPQLQQPPMPQPSINFYPSPPQSNPTVQPGLSSPQVPMAMDIDPQPVQTHAFDPNWMYNFLNLAVNTDGDPDNGGGSIMMADFEADFTEADFIYFDLKPSAETDYTLADHVDASLWDMGDGSVHATPAAADTQHTLPSPMPEKTSPKFRVENVKVTAAEGGWDAIPFPEDFRAADGKYNVGKFKSGLASPPYEPDGWYERKTDPRLGMVKRLLTMKGKGRLEPRTGVDDWEREWAETRGGMTTEVVEEDSDEDMEEDSDEDDLDGTRPSTPLPIYLPLGPTLLPLQFKHEYMLPLSGPLRAGVNPASGSGVAIGTGVSSVPTPVSPGRGGKGRALEVMVECLAREVVENGVWADVWNEVNVPMQSPGEIWDYRVHEVSKLFASVKGLKAPLTMDELFGLHSPSPSHFEKLEPPELLMGKGDAVIQILPPAIRFWDKLGVGPRSGRKDIQAFVVVDMTQEDLSLRITEWLGSLGTAYDSKHYGKITPGRSEFCNDGILHMSYDSSLRKSIDAFVTSLQPPPPRTRIVVFVVTPTATMSLQSSILRQIFSVIRKTSKSPESQILFQLIPEQILRTEYSPQLGRLCLSLYDRILVPVVRSMSRKLFQAGEVKKYLEDPAFVLARTPVDSKVMFGPPKGSASASVLDAGTFLHVAYAVSECGRWVCAACVDQRGEGHDLGVWLTVKGGGGGDAETEVEETVFLVSKVWEFASRFSKKANVEWRIVIAKLGAMDKSELGAWTSHLENGAFEPTEMRPVHVSIVAVEPSTPWMFTSRPDFTDPPPHLKNIGRSASVSSSKPSKNVYVDISATTYALYQHPVLPVSVPPTAADIGLDAHHIPDPDPSVEVEHEEYPHTLPLVPHASSTLIRVPESGNVSMLHVHLVHVIRSVGCVYPARGHEELVRDVTRSYFGLAVLGGLKGMGGGRSGGGGGGGLPWHLGAVERMKWVVEGGSGEGDT